MNIRSFFTDLFDGWGAGAPTEPGPSVNPATGLPMMSGAVDVHGNPFGVDLHRHDREASVSSSWGGSDDHHHRSSFDDHWSGSVGSIGTGWDSSSSSVTSSSWPDHSSSSLGTGYDPSRGW